MYVVRAVRHQAEEGEAVTKHKFTRIVTENNSVEAWVKQYEIERPVVRDEGYSWASWHAGHPIVTVTIQLYRPEDLKTLGLDRATATSGRIRIIPVQ